MLENNTELARFELSFEYDISWQELRQSLRYQKTDNKAPLSGARH